MKKIQNTFSRILLNLAFNLEILCSFLLSYSLVRFEKLKIKVLSDISDKTCSFTNHNSLCLITLQGPCLHDFPVSLLHVLFFFFFFLLQVWFTFIKVLLLLSFPNSWLQASQRESLINTMQINYICLALLSSSTSAFFQSFSAEQVGHIQTGNALPVPWNC